MSKVESRRLSTNMMTTKVNDTNVLDHQIPEPQGLQENFINVPWYDDCYRGRTYEGYAWYILPSYIRQMIYYGDEINLLPMREPSSHIFQKAYRQIIT